MARQLNDLEAHLNTSIITERSIRKAQDKQLAEEMDLIRQELGAKAGKQAAEEGGAVQDALEKDAQIKGLSQDLVEQQEELKTLQTEFKELMELAE